MTALPAAGDTFADRYRVHDRLGQGGHGAVFRATDTFLDTDVALKILLPEQLDGVGRDRFRREAELGERLTSPHSVRIYGHGEDGNGVPYIAFELLEGSALSRHLADHGPLPLELVTQIARATLDALAEAHDLGMVHRDIKPANIYLCEYRGSADFVKVLDFGIAKRSDRNATQLTAADVVVGTARYMAPEQIRGDEISAATDLYSLGLVMAELLMAEPVFRGAIIDMCIEQVSARGVPLPQAVLASPLGAIIARATDKHPPARYRTAREMLAALPSSGPRTAFYDDEGPTQVVVAPAPMPQVPPRPGATLIYGDDSAVAPTPAPAPAAATTLVFGVVPGSDAPISVTAIHSPAASLLALPEVPTSNPVIAAVPTSTPPFSAASLSIPPSHPAFSPRTSHSHPSPGPTDLARPVTSTTWVLGILTAFVLLAALLAAGALLATSPQSAEAPPPMPSSR